MRVASGTLAALLVAGSLPLIARSAMAAPIGQPMALKNVDLSVIEPAQFRRGHRGRWIGPAIGGFAAGVAVGSALAAPRYHDDGYYAYGAAPGYVAPGYGAPGAVAPGYVEPGYVAPGYVAPGDVEPGYAYDPRVRASPQYGSCTGDRNTDSGYPSWMCR